MAIVYRCKSCGGSHRAPTQLSREVRFASPQMRHYFDGARYRCPATDRSAAYEFADHSWEADAPDSSIPASGLSPSVAPVQMPSLHAVSNTRPFAAAGPLREIASSLPEPADENSPSRTPIWLRPDAARIPPEIVRDRPLYSPYTQAVGYLAALILSLFHRR